MYGYSVEVDGEILLNSVCAKQEYYVTDSLSLALSLSLSLSLSSHSLSLPYSSLDLIVTPTHAPTRDADSSSIPTITDTSHSDSSVDPPLESLAPHSEGETITRPATAAASSQHHDHMMTHIGDISELSLEEVAR